MSVEIVLHIGISKTGSTSIQRWLADICRPACSGVYFPDASGLPFTSFGNHEGLVLFAGSESVWISGHATQLFNRIPIEVARHDRAAFLKIYGESLARCIRAAAESGCSRLLLSNEHMSERLDTSDIVSFTDRLRPLFSSMTLVVYLREQSMVYPALYGEMVKHGSRLTFAEFSNTAWVHRRFDYDRLLMSWAECEWTVRPAIYRERADSGPQWNVVSDFATQVWAVADDEPLTPAPDDRHNVSHRTETYEMMARINSTRMPASVRRRLLSSMDLLPLFPRRFSARNEGVLQEIRARHADGNRKVARTYFGREDLF